MASFLSDRIVDEILESLSRSQHTLVSVLSVCLSVFLSVALSIHPSLLPPSVSRPTIWSGRLSLCCVRSPRWRQRFWMRWFCSQRTTTRDGNKAMTGTRNMGWRIWTPAWWENTKRHKLFYTSRCISTFIKRVTKSLNRQRYCVVEYSLIISSFAESSVR